MLQCFAVCCSVLARHHLVAAEVGICCSVLQCVAVCCLDVTLLQKKTSIHAYIVSYASWYVYVYMWSVHVYRKVLARRHCVAADLTSVCCGRDRCMLQCVAVCYSGLNCSHVCSSAWAQRHCVAVEIGVCCSVLQCAPVCCSILQCAPVCCSVLQFVAVCGLHITLLQQQSWIHLFVW